MEQSIPNHQTMSQRNKTIWNIVKNDDKNAELMLYGDIAESFWGDTISAKEVTEYLTDLDVENINVYINSNGGVVDTAIAINNALRRHKAKVTVNIDGIAASAATLITCAGDTVRMPKNALFMIHNPLTIAMGDSEEMRKQADVLEKHKNSILETYLQKVNIDKEKLSELMDNETWLSAEEALEYGFIDEIIENADIQVVENKVISNNMVFNMAEFKNFNVDKNIKNNGKGSEKMKEKLEEAIIDIIDFRDENGGTLAELYGTPLAEKNPKPMNENLLNLHKYLDKVVDSIYSEREFKNDEERLALLLKMYKEKMEG